MTDLETTDVTETDDRLCERWYIKYPLDSLALGPLEFDSPVSAEKAIEQAEEQFGEKPSEIWPKGHCVEVEEYKYTLTVPKEDT